MAKRESQFIRERKFWIAAIAIFSGTLIQISIIIVSVFSDITPIDITRFFGLLSAIVVAYCGANTASKFSPSSSQKKTPNTDLDANIDTN